MKKKSKDFLANLFGLLMLLSIIYNLIIAFHAEIIIILSIMVLLYLGLKIIEDYLEKKKNDKIRDSGILEIDKMSGYEFEAFLKYLFEKLQYDVIKVTSKSGDYGADLIIKDKTLGTIAVQAKRYNNNVSPRAVQEVCGALGYYNCDHGMVVTNSFLTSSAKTLANKNNIEVWERDKLIDKLNSLNN